MARRSTASSAGRTSSCSSCSSAGAAFFAYALVRFRKSRNPVANYGGVRSHASTYLEGGVLVVELVLLFAFSIPLWAARVDHVPPETDALVVHVTGGAVRVERPLRRA